MPALKNYMEDIVFDILGGALQDLNVCTCKKCTYDIAAITLNTLPPKYVVTKKGELYTKISSLQQQFNVDIIAAIAQAAIIVNEHPRHE